METPDLNYNHWLQKWYDNNGNKNVFRVSYSDFRGTLTECENAILEIVNQENITDIEILRVIDLINQWGGGMSRGFYLPKVKTLKDGQKLIRIPREVIKLPENINRYREGITLARDNNSDSINYFRQFGIASSYIGKHAYFWSNYNLPIIDAKIAGVLGYRTSQSLLSNNTYESIIEHMRNIQTNHELNRLYNVEKGFFAFHKNYFNNTNTAFKNNIIDFIDCQYAIYIAGILEIVIPQYIYDNCK